MEKLFAHQLPQHGQHGKNHDAQGNQGKVLLDYGDIAKEIAAAYEESYPNHSADNIVMSKGQVVHLAYTGHEGSKGTHDGYEAGQENGLVPMFGIKGAGLVHMLFFDEAVLGVDHGKA